jgi:hypothetical protein
VCTPACDQVLKVLGQALVRVAGKCVPMAVLVEFCPKCRRHYELRPGWLRRYLKPPALTA